MAARNDTRTLNPMDQHPATSVHPNVILDAQAQSLARIERHLVTIKGWVMFGGLVLLAGLLGIVLLAGGLA
jgi:hypothetical protein